MLQSVISLFLKYKNKHFQMHYSFITCCKKYFKYFIPKFIEINDDGDIKHWDLEFLHALKILRGQCIIHRSKHIFFITLEL